MKILRQRDIQFFLDKIVALENIKKNLEFDVSHKESKIKDLENRIDQLVTERYNIVAECNFAIDFDSSFPVFSIERHYDNRGVREKTLISYVKDEDSKLGEWEFQCSRETHERLIKEFNQFLSLKRQGAVHHGV